MKNILKTVPKDLKMKYDEKFDSEINTEIMRDLIPRLVKSLKRYKVTYSQVRAVLVRDNVQGKFQCPGHVLDIVPSMSRPSVPSKYPIIFCYNKGFKLTYLGQY